MTDEQVEQVESDKTDDAKGDPQYPDDLVAAVTAAQLAVCTQVVPEALKIRLAAAAEVPAGQWRRSAGSGDPRVLEIEAPYRRLVAPGDEQATTKAAKKATGDRRRHGK